MSFLVPCAKLSPDFSYFKSHCTGVCGLVAFDLIRRVLYWISLSGDKKGGKSRTFSHFAYSKRKLSLRAIMYSRISLVFARLRVPITFIFSRAVSII